MDDFIPILETDELEYIFGQEVICESRYLCNYLAEWIVIAPFMFDNGRKSMVICDKHRLLHIDSNSRDGLSPCTYLPL